MEGQAPTVVVYGAPEDAEILRTVAGPGRWGLVQDNGRARDAVFTVYENLGRADAVIAFPNAHPLHLVTLLAEAEVGHPLIVQKRGPGAGDFQIKPIIFFGSPTEWRPFNDAFAAMREQGLMRGGFERLVHFAAGPAAVRAWIEGALPRKLPTTRVHYYLHAQKPADMAFDARGDVRPPSPITVSCFGSASTRSAAHLERADQAARMCARRDWNILHGGGDRGVMGRLSESAAKFKVYTIGVTVHSSGAPKITFEKKDGDARPEDIDEHIASKDMLHRIESYAGNAQAFVSLDGGIGSVQEDLVIAELLARRHPALMYETISGELAPKPLWLLNAGGIYTPLMSYLEKQEGFEYLVRKMQAAHSLRELEAGLQRHFSRHPPRPLSLEERHDFRERYADMAPPLAPAALGAEIDLPQDADGAIRLPNLAALACEPDREAERGRLV